jgi:hypothetical protein
VYVESLACGHVAVVGSSRVCAHLIGFPEDVDVEYFRILRGTGLSWDLCCKPCDSAGCPQLIEVCEGCVARADEEQEYNLLGWRGSPGILERPEPYDTTLVATSLPWSLRGAVDIAPVGDRPGVWLVLTADGAIARWNVDEGSESFLAKAAVPDESGGPGWAGHSVGPRLHASANGWFAAVVNDFGRHGAVLDLRTGKTTMVLDGGTYHPETVPFALAFTQHAGRAVVIHRTAWNRLDISDPATGALLTDRGPTSYQRGEPRPERYLDYFHGRVLPSPGGTWIADDGGVWGPAGIPALWSLRRWLASDCWESESGPSRRTLCQRAYLWNVAMCWIDEEHLAIAGIGIDDEAMLDGARIFHAETGTQVRVFAGPRGRFFADERRLYAAAPDALEIWDPYTGERTATIVGFTPTHHHTGSRELAVLKDGELLRWHTRHR